MRAFGGTFVKPGQKQTALEIEAGGIAPAGVGMGAPPDVGVGADWLQEHVQTEYEIAWSNPVLNQYPGSTEHSDAAALDAVQKQWVNNPNEQDAAMKVTALSRWNNYYVEGAWAPSAASEDSIVDPHIVWFTFICCCHFVHLAPNHTRPSADDSRFRRRRPVPR
jgi:hypothetical protein